MDFDRESVMCTVHVLSGPLFICSLSVYSPDVVFHSSNFSWRSSCHLARRPLFSVIYVDDTAPPFPVPVFRRYPPPHAKSRSPFVLLIFIVFSHECIARAITREGLCPMSALVFLCSANVVLRMLEIDGVCKIGQHLACRSFVSRLASYVDVFASRICDQHIYFHACLRAWLLCVCWSVRASGPAPAANRLAEPDLYVFVRIRCRSLPRTYIISFFWMCTIFRSIC